MSTADHTPNTSQGRWPPAVVAALITSAVVLVGQHFQIKMSEERMKQEADQFRQKQENDEKQFRQKLDKDLKDAEVLRKRELEQRAKDFRLKFYEMQLTTYRQLMEVSGKIIATENESCAHEAFEKLNAMMVTDVRMLADPSVVQATIEFHKAVGRYCQLRSKPDTPAANLKEQWRLLVNAARQLALECRNSLRHAFELPEQFGDIPPTPILIPSNL
jgi:hypothetical protein